MSSLKESLEGDWLEIAVEVAGIDSELAADIFRQKCPGGVAIEPAFTPVPAFEGYVTDGDSPALVKGYVPVGEETSDVRDSLKLALSMAPLQTPAKWRRTRRIAGERWRDSWKRYFRTRKVGQALVIKPSWATYRARAGETVIEIDPGMAFGTGQHPTTALCLRALEELVRPGASVLDIGTGSGILAIAAAKLGATRVRAVDIEEMAVKAARQNAAANGVSDIVETREGSIDAEAVARERFDLIVANISSVAIERLAATMSLALKPGALLVASGFLQDAVGVVSNALSKAGLIMQGTMEEGSWRAVLVRKP